ncbi:MAG: transglutaminase-like domain-containing protein [Planctomycetota bacterium]|nr:transglutaminase-like domain-containing protein [Planctomycetota bacterium]
MPAVAADAAADRTGEHGSAAERATERTPADGPREQVRGAAGAANERVLREDWLLVFLAGARAGYGRARVVERDENGGKFYETLNEQHIRVARGAFKMSMSQSSLIVEDARGKPVRFETATKQSANTQKTSGRIEDGKIIYTVEGIGQPKRYEKPFPGDTVGPVKAEKDAMAKGLAPGASMTHKVFVPELTVDKAVLMTWEVIGPEERDILGVKRRMHKVKTTTDFLPGVPMWMWMDDNRSIWASETTMMMLKIETFKTDRETALRALAGDPADVMAATAIRPDRPIEGLPGLPEARYAIEGLRELPGGEFQDVERDAGGTLRVRITAWDPSREKAGYTMPYAKGDMDSYLAETPFVQTREPKVVAMAREAVGGEKDPVKAALRIQSFVRRKLARKGYGVGFASAAEVAERLEGDCTEHAILCVALARASGIPARGVVGIAYDRMGHAAGPDARPGAGATSTGAFAFHMWAEVFVGRWVPIDAAMRGFDVAHIAMGRSDLSGANPNADLVAPVAGAIGQMKIHVLEPRGASGDAPPSER